MNSLLRHLAQKNEIDLIGICDLNMLNAQKEKFTVLKAEDVAFGVGEPSRRLDYKRVWSKTEGIISFALSYKNAINPPDDMTGRGVISRFSYGRDYHDVLKEKAKNLMSDFIKKYDCDYKIFVDSGILSDRMIAYCSGLGFIGKNRFLINEKYGSFIFLGHILVDIALLTAENTSTSKCENCVECLISCPNNAIGDKLLDFKNCISYITQTGLSPGVNSHRYLYGCDICQLSCPFNQDSPECIHREFTENIDFDYAYPRFDDILEINDDGGRYSCSALMWKGIKTLKHNAACLKDFYKKSQ